MTKQTLTVPIEIDQQLLSDAIIVAADGGCRWCSGVKVFGSMGKPTNLVALTESDEDIIGRCSIVFTEKNNESHTLNLVLPAQLQAGLVLMAKEHPRFFGDLNNGDIDDENADVLIQLSLFGSLKYE